MTEEQSRDLSDTPRDMANEGPLIYTAESLFRGRKEVWIELDGNRYRLRITAAGKLYMTK